MAENAANEVIDYVPWYLDDSGQPVCPSFWEEFDCEKPNCLFSHKIAKYLTSVVFNEDLSSDLVAFHSYICKYVQDHPNKEPINQVPVSSNNENEKEFDKIDQLFDEMAEFERGANLVDDGSFCPLLSETGNCVLANLCGYQHEAQLKDSADADWQDAWLPDYMNCECCKGYVYMCQDDGCKSNGKCLKCVGKT